MAAAVKVFATIAQTPGVCDGQVNCTKRERKCRTADTLHVTRGCQEVKEALFLLVHVGYLVLS